MLAIAAAGKNSLDDYVFLSCETNSNIQQYLNDGYRAFIISPEAPINKILNETDSFLAKNEDEFVTFILKQKNSVLSEKIEGHPINKFLSIPGEHSVHNLKECKKQGKRFFIFMPGKTSFTFPIENYICEYKVPAGFPSEIKSGFGSNPANGLVIFKIDHIIPNLSDTLKQHPELLPQLFNSYTGKLPNFFVTKHKDVFSAYHKKISQQRWYSATVEYNNKPLNGIRWKEMPLMTSFGKIHTTEIGLSPYKDGFHFSPDVFNFNNHTSESTKIFFARPKNFKDGMVLHLAFDESTDNLAAENTEIPYSNVDYQKDPTRGWCAVFNGRDNYIDFDTEIVFNENFTVSVWVNPTETVGNRSIIGKGEALSIKFRDGNMLFTSPGIKDHATDSALIICNQWQHLTYVISSGETVKFYKNGCLAEAQEAERIEPTEHSLLVGTNLWDESFKGKMDDLIIWNRNLSEEEVKHLYEQGIEETKQFPSRIFVWSAIILVALVCFLFILFRKKRKQNKKPVAKNITKNNSHGSQQRQIKGPAIELFGGFKITNCDKNDLTSYFSPRRKQIFILVLIETLRRKGISSKQLTNHLWAGYSPESAKNNRSTQVQRIRETLAQNSGISIAYSDKKWIIELDGEVYCDLADYYNLLEEFKQSQQDNVDFNLLASLLSIIEKGTLLPNMDDEWLDDFKSKISDELLDIFLPLFANDNFVQETEWIIRLSRALLIFDPLNETVLEHNIKALVKLGKNTQAHESLEHFEKVYQQCYAQPFGKSFSDLIE